MSNPNSDRSNAGRNRLTLISLTVIVLVMVGLSFAAVPLYRLFCEVTGFNGTTQRANEAANHIVNRTVEIRFNANVAPELPWNFRPEVRKVDVKLGESSIVAFRAENKSDQPISGTATYNVTPEKVGQYFVKVQCFCFQEQTLEAHASADLPVYFFVDPDFAKDPDMADVRSITLSYTFFRARPSDTAEKSAAVAGPASPVK